MPEETGAGDSISAYKAFEMVEMRVGRVVRLEENSKARKPAYKLWIDFGAEMGIKTSSAQVVVNYSMGSLKDRLVICAVNLGTRNIAGFGSEVLTLGVPDENGNVVLLMPDREVLLGSRIY
jgi:tRNA-binding protein